MLSRVCQTAESLLIKVGPVLCEDWLTYRGQMGDLRMMIGQLYGYLLGLAHTMTRPAPQTRPYDTRGRRCARISSHNGATDDLRRLHGSLAPCRMHAPRIQSRNKIDTDTYDIDDFIAMLQR